MISPQQIRGARAMLGMTQADLAERVKLSATAINSIERGVSDPRASNLAAIQRALEAAGVIFIAEDTHGPGVRLLRTTAFETALASLVALHGSADPLDRVEAIVAGFSMDDRGVLSGCFGDRVWGEPRREADRRGCEIQERLTRTGDFHPSRKSRPAFDAEGTPDGWTTDPDEADRGRR